MSNRAGQIDLNFKQAQGNTLLCLLIVNLSYFHIVCLVGLEDFQVILRIKVSQLDFSPV